METSFKSSHETQKRAATVLNDARTGRPGQSAFFDKHIPIFHTMQRTFASYDTYARISVDVSVPFWLMAVGYYFISFTMAYDCSAALLSEHIVTAILSWCGVAAMLSVGSVLMGLKLFVSTRHAFWVHVFLQSDPLLGCLAVHLHVRERHGAVERIPVHINPATIALLSIVGLFVLRHIRPWRLMGYWPRVGSIRLSVTTSSASCSTLTRPRVQHTRCRTCECSSGSCLGKTCETCSR